MCGIIGILMKPADNTSKEIVNHIENGLHRLQNRGYDSCGVGLLNATEFIVEKHASTTTSNSLALLSTQLAARINSSWNLTCGIGHNRWATHGAKTDANAHPHLSYDRRFMIVHNGIIENYTEIKESLPPLPYLSETDTEVIAHHLAHCYQDTKDTLESIRNTISKLQGTYGLVIVNRDEPNRLFCVRNGSPLLVGFSETFALVTSEQSGFNNSVNTYITLENDDICVLALENAKITVSTTGSYKTNSVINQLAPSPTPDPYAHWTLKEIHEQPTTILNTINHGGRILNDHEVKLGGLEKMATELQVVRHVVLLGCGSSYNAALYGAALMKQVCNFVTVNVIDAAELCFSDLPKTNDPLGVFLITQSGETKDLHRCIALLNSRPTTTPTITIGIVNVIDSLIAREVNCGIYCNSGTEVGVASTKSFTSQVVCLSLAAIWFAQKQNVNKSLRTSMITSLQNLSNDYSKTLALTETHVKELAQTAVLKGAKSMFILGKGTDMFIADESALKIKEISYIHTESYSASSLKHGPFALLDPNFPVIIINSQDEYNSKITSCYEEIKARNSPLIIITNNILNIPAIRQSNNLKKSTTSTPIGSITIPTNKHYSSLLALIPLQLLSYYLSINKNINPDTPKNLAKVVTVE